MPWYEKEQPTPFDNTPVTGLEFLNGGVLAKRARLDWLAGKKYPVISFPSDMVREVRSDAEGAQRVHLFGRMSVPYQATLDEAFMIAGKLAVEHGYDVVRRGNHRLLLGNPLAGRVYEITFDEQRGFLTDITLHPPEVMELLTGDGRAILPPLYHNESFGLAAIAPMKFFTPDSNWTWYPTEFDGDDIFFGLVSGYALELGYFTLSELEGVRGIFGLPVERDRHYEPLSLRALLIRHERDRY